jgi:2,4-dienoyl-CoA reductase-like NADH-dependent reductase (Old Yellow Enzyme family)
MDDLLFTPLTLRGLSLRNRMVLSPMCQYSARDGLPSAWHFLHYTERAKGGVGLVMIEATAVLPEGRITPFDLGLWDDGQVELLRGMADAVHAQGAKAGIQLAHAGRKASTDAPWRGGKPLGSESGGWGVRGASALPYNDGYPTPLPLSAEDLGTLEEAFVAAAGRALAAGFDVIELHAAHGYLVHQFLSPLSNRRDDEWGGDEAGRFRLCLRLARALRRAWPEDRPLFVRLSATDWVEGGWDLESTIRLGRALRELGVDLVDVSSGGLSPAQKVSLGPCYQAPFAAAVRRETGLHTSAVGLITTAAEARGIVDSGSADLVFLGRQLLRDPYWPIRIAPSEAGLVPPQYLRAFP